MKQLTILLCIFLFVGQLYSQRRPENQKPEILIPAPHTWDYESTQKNLPAKSFYESKDDWQYMIDTTWGPGLPLEDKLDIFNTYTQVLTEKFDGFNSLGIDQSGIC